jgi:plastocyanin
VPSLPRLWSTAALLLAAAICSAAGHAPVPAPTGRIAGAVTLSRALTAKRPRLRFYGDYGPGSLPPAHPNDTSEFVNVVIYLDSVTAADGAGAQPQGELAIRQKNQTFVPHVLPVVAGATVEFPNDDPVFHNVFSLSSARSFDLGRYPKGASKSVRFNKPGTVQVFCHIHSDMSAIVLVLDNPFFTVATAGRYELEGVPPGEYRLIAWHERVRPIVQRVLVRAGETTALDLNVPLPPPVGTPP